MDMEWQGCTSTRLGDGLGGPGVLYEKEGERSPCRQDSRASAKNGTLEPQEPLPGGARVRVGGAQGLKELDGSKVDAEVILDMTEEAILLLQFGWMDVMGMANQGRGRVAVGCEGGQGRCEGGWMNTVYKFICSLQLDPVREIVLLHATSLLFARKWVCAWAWVWEWAWAWACWPLCD